MPHFANWPARKDEECSGVVEQWIQSTCVLLLRRLRGRYRRWLGQNCGSPGGAKRIGRIEAGWALKGLHSGKANNNPDRLLRPLIRRQGILQESSWEDAMSLLVGRSKEVKKRLGPGALGIYNSGQLMLEEYYTLTVLADCGLQTPHVDGNTRLCTSTAAIALIESFGIGRQSGVI